MARRVCKQTETVQKGASNMSLLDEAFEDFIIMNKVTESDGLGGTTTTWQEGAVIRGAVVYNSSVQNQIALQMGSATAYTFTFRKNVLLDYHDVLKRVSDSKIFRITSDSDDMRTPAGAGLNMRNYTAEEWELTNG